MAHRGTDPAYAARVADQDTFADEVRAVHRRVTSALDSAGRRQIPWLRTIGTPPWAVARELGLLTGTSYVVRDARRGHDVWRHVRGATQQRPVAVYVGNRWVPRHVVLVVGRTEGPVEDGTLTYEPSTGHVTLVSRSRWAEGPLRLAGWQRPWFAVVPVTP